MNSHRDNSSAEWLPDDLPKFLASQKVEQRLRGLRDYLRRAYPQVASDEVVFDAVSTVVVRMTKEPDGLRFGSEEGFHNYVWTTAKRDAQRRQRSAQKEQGDLLEYAQELSRERAHSRDPSDALGVVEEIELLKRLIDEILRPSEREILNLLMRGLDRRKIAAQLGKSTASVRSTIHRAKQRILAHLKR